MIRVLLPGHSISVLALVFAVLMSNLATAQTRPPQPILQSEAISYNFGEVIEGATVKHEFIIKNRGSADLIINRVIANCGCTRSRVEPMIIAPMTSGKLIAEFDTGGFAGAHSKRIRLYSNDPDNSVTTFILNGSVTADIIASPEQVRFNGVLANQEAKSDLKLTLTSAASGRIVAVIPGSEKIQVSGEIHANGREWKGSVSLTKDIPLGEISERVIVLLEDNRKQNVSIPVVGWIEDEIKLTPPIISFGLVEKEKKVERRIKLENRALSKDKNSLEVKSLSISDPAVTGRILEIDPGRSWILIFELDPIKLKPSQDPKGLVTINTNQQTPRTLSFFGVVE